MQGESRELCKVKHHYWKICFKYVPPCVSKQENSSHEETLPPYAHSCPRKPMYPEHFLKTLTLITCRQNYSGCSVKWLAYSPLIYIYRTKKVVYFSWDLNRNQTPISVSRTLVPLGSQEPSLKLTVIGVIGDSTDWQGRIHRMAPLIPRSTCSSFLKWGVKEPYTKHALVIHVLWRQRKRQDFWSSTSCKHHLLSLLLQTSPPFPGWTDR